MRDVLRYIGTGLFILVWVILLLAQFDIWNTCGGDWMPIGECVPADIPNP